MPQAKTKARGAATNGAVPSVTFRGLKLILNPAEEVGAVIFDITDGEISEALRRVMGMEQYLKVQDKCTKEKLTPPQVVTALRELLTDCMGQYGFDMGE